MTTATATKSARTLIAAATSNAAGATTRGTLDLRTAFGGLLTIKITNGGTGPAAYRVRSPIRTWRVNATKRSWTAKSNSKGLIMPLPIKDPEEIKTVTFDFTGDAATITGAEVTAISSGGLRDATPANVLGTEQTIDGALVYRRIKLGQPGSTYTLRCKATDADGEVHVVSAYLPVAVQVPQ